MDEVRVNFDAVMVELNFIQNIVYHERRILKLMYQDRNNKIHDEHLIAQYEAQPITHTKKARKCVNNMDYMGKK